MVWKDLILEAPPGFEPGVEVLQTSALPLGDGAVGEPVGELARSATSAFATEATADNPHMARQP